MFVRARKFLGVLAAACLLVCGPLGAFAQSSQTAEEQDRRELLAYVLTLDKLKKLERIGQAIEDWRTQNEQASQRLDDDQSLAAASLAERARLIELHHPGFAAAVRKQGMSTREYVLAISVVFRAINDEKGTDETVSAPNRSVVHEHIKEALEVFKHARVKA